jgi:hypothetical protein
MFQVFHLSFLYIESVASVCFKSRFSVTHGMRVGSRREHEESLCERRSGGVGARVGASDAGTVERSLGNVGPRVDAQNGGKTDCSRRGHPNASSAVEILIF